MNHAEWVKFEVWSVESHQEKKCRSCGILGQGLIEVEDAEGFGCACISCCGEEQELADKGKTNEG